MLLEDLVEFLVDRGVEVELVLETAATAADDPHAQVHLVVGAGGLLLGDDPPNFIGRFGRDRDAGRCRRSFGLETDGFLFAAGCHERWRHTLHETGI